MGSSVGRECDVGCLLGWDVSVTDMMVLECMVPTEIRWRMIEGGGKWRGSRGREKEERNKIGAPGDAFRENTPS